MKIMIVDDHADMRRVLRKVISGSVSEISEIIDCETGEDALIQYPIYKPDCVLMDIELKSMNGFTVTEEILRQDENANIVIVTSYDTPAFRRKAKKLHTVGFVSKDNLIDVNTILKTIK